MNKKAFTLVELSIVLVIIGILMALTVKGRSLITTAKYRAEVSKMRNMEIALSSYYSKNMSNPDIVFTTVGSAKIHSFNLKQIIDGGFLNRDDFSSVIGGMNPSTKSNYDTDLAFVIADRNMIGSRNDFIWIVMSKKIPDADLANPSKYLDAAGSNKYACMIKKLLDEPPYKTNSGRVRAFTGFNFDNDCEKNEAITIWVQVSPL